MKFITGPQLKEGYLNIGAQALCRLSNEWGTVTDIATNKDGQRMYMITLNVDTIRPELRTAPYYKDEHFAQLAVQVGFIHALKLAFKTFKKFFKIAELTEKDLIINVEPKAWLEDEEGEM